ncbi:MAG TPA: helix-turn-helix domain-containing protein [Terriglobales bacterium]|nr:helix-turn-helix domain-containing protein [Terriglobales bacterium]
MLKSSRKAARREVRGRQSRQSEGAGFDLITPQELADILRVHKNWVYGHQSELPTIRLGRYIRFRRRDIHRMLEARVSCL